MAVLAGFRLATRELLITSFALDKHLLSLLSAMSKKQLWRRDDASPSLNGHKSPDDMSLSFRCQGPRSSWLKPTQAPCAPPTTARPVRPLLKLLREQSWPRRQPRCHPLFTKRQDSYPLRGSVRVLAPPFGRQDVFPYTHLFPSFPSRFSLFSFFFFPFWNIALL